MVEEGRRKAGVPTGGGFVSVARDYWLRSRCPLLSRCLVGLRLNLGRPKMAISSRFSCPGFGPVFPCNKARYLTLSAMEGRSPRRIVPGRRRARAYGRSGEEAAGSRSRRRPYASASDTPSSHCGRCGAPRRGVALRPQDGRGTKTCRRAQGETVTRSG